MGRAPCCEKNGLKKGRWTGEEDEILKKYIQHHGEGSWRSLPKNAGLLRCGKSCRLRWINYLRADLRRGCFSAEEEDIIIKLHASYGNRWSLIAGHLPGRTDNEIKNYWNSHLSRRIQTFARFREARSSMLIDARKLAVGCQRKNGRNINRMGFKRKSGNGDIRREKEENKGSKSVEKETQSTTLSDTESRVLDPCEERESVVQVETFVLGGEWEEMGMVLDPFEGMESGFLDLCDEIESGTMMDLCEEIEGWVFGSDEETRNEIRGGEIGQGVSEERQNGVMGLNEDRETGVIGVNGEDRGRNGELCSPMDSGCEEWDLGVLGVEGTEFLSWLCDCESWERELEVVAEHEQRSFIDWLLSGDSVIV